MTSDATGTKDFDLEERTARFGEAVIAFAKQIRERRDTPNHRATRPRGTSIGANYAEADDCDSRKDFRFKIGLCRREARETKHWVRMIVAAEPQLRGEARAIWQEAKELNLIFGAIRRRT